MLYNTHATTRICGTRWNFTFAVCIDSGACRRELTRDQPLRQAMGRLAAVMRLLLIVVVVAHGCHRKVMLVSREATSPSAQKKNSTRGRSRVLLKTRQFWEGQLPSARNCKPGSVSSWRKSPMSIANLFSFLYNVCREPKPSASLVRATLQSFRFKVSVITRLS